MTLNDQDTPLEPILTPPTVMAASVNAFKGLYVFIHVMYVEAESRSVDDSLTQEHQDLWNNVCNELDGILKSIADIVATLIDDEWEPEAL